MKTAKLIREKIKGFNGHANEYQLDPPLDGHTFVIVSATVVPYSGPETYIFESDGNGVITGWMEMEGSFRGGLNHAEALENAGYEITR